MNKKTIQAQKVDTFTLSKGSEARIQVAGAWYKTSPILHYAVTDTEIRVETQNSIYICRKEKKSVEISFCDLGSLKKGESATLVADGKLIATSPVIAYHVAGGRVTIETENTIYHSKEEN